MADGTVARPSRGHRTICLPISEEAYQRIVNDPREFRTADRRVLPADARTLPAGLRRGLPTQG